MWTAARQRPGRTVNTLSFDSFEARGTSLHQQHFYPNQLHLIPNKEAKTETSPTDSCHKQAYNLTACLFRDWKM